MQSVYIFIVYIFLFFIFLGAGFLSFSSKDRKYNLLNHFPYELEIEKNFPYLRCIYSLFVVSAMIFHLFVFVFYRDINAPLFLDHIFLVFSLFLDMFIFMIFVSKIKYSFKTHIVFSSFYFTLTIANHIFSIYYIYKSSYYSLYFTIPFIIFVIIELIFIFSPALKKSFLVSKDDNGRKKYNHYAFCEWLFLIMNIISNMILLIMKVI